MIREIENRRSIRKYRSDEIDRKLIEEIIYSATLAPSAKNRQPWKFIVYQGEEGAYSQMAMQQFFHDTTNSYHVQTWRDAMEAIAKGEADYAVLPIENSSAGIVSENYDLLVEYDNCIVG